MIHKKNTKKPSVQQLHLRNCDKNLIMSKETQTACSVFLYRFNKYTNLQLPCSRDLIDALRIFVVLLTLH